jgi:hypothetical protein
MYQRFYEIWGKNTTTTPVGGQAETSDKYSENSYRKVNQRNYRKKFQFGNLLRVLWDCFITLSSN